MVLSPRVSAVDSKMLGRRIPHPASTNFNQDDALPAAKRLRTVDHDKDSDNSETDGSPLRSGNSMPRPRNLRMEIPDSEEDSGDSASEDDIVHHVTELESALPPIKTDKEAIAEYEAMKAVEHTSDSPQANTKDRLDSRKWVRGKSSIYVDAFNLALETVLEDEAHLFDEAEREVFEQWRSLDYEAQYL